MRATVFFAGNNDGVKLSFTRLSLKKALENINKKSVGNEFSIINSIVVKKPKVVRDFIANRISSNKIVNTDLYNISDIEIKEIISYTRIFFSIKITKKFNEEYDSDSEYIPSSVENDSATVENDSAIVENDSATVENDSATVETTSEMKSSYEPKSKYFLVKEYFILYSTAFIIYSIYQYTKSNNCLSN
jgi:hypothetical protein